jgi:arginyl-tRNA synthetase
MYYLDKKRNDLARAINSYLGNELVEAGLFQFPPDPKMGDLSLPCFIVAKSTAQNPAQAASAIASFLSQPDSLQKFGLSRVDTIGPYLNIFLDKTQLFSEVLKEIRTGGEAYGQNESGGGQKTMIEYSNVNTHKEYHIGHLRNLCFGDSVHRLMRANGYQSIPVSYVNDFGIHVAKTLWAFMQKRDEKLPENKGFFLGKTYVEACRLLKEKPEAKEEVGEIMKKIESRDSEEYRLWQETRQWSIEQFDGIYNELGVCFEKTYYENETIDEGKVMVAEMLEKGILKQSEGAVIADLTESDLGVLVVLRSDGTATYPVADLPLAKRKFDEFGLDASIYVVDIRQSLYFKQLFHLMRALGYKQPMIHLPFDFVTLPDGMMSSRTGNVITYEELKGALVERMSRETRARHEDWEEERVREVAEALMRAVIKFEMLKIGAKQIITFDMDKAVSFQGYSAAYLLYTIARIESVLRKSGEDRQAIADADTATIAEGPEIKLVYALSRYPEAVKQSAKDFDPSIIARYIFALAQDFNDYYHSVQILKAEADSRLARLSLILSVSQVLRNGLSLLGIEAIDEM